MGQLHKRGGMRVATSRAAKHSPPCATSAGCAVGGGQAAVATACAKASGLSIITL
jgi:hypothetical protein